MHPETIKQGLCVTEVTAGVHKKHTHGFDFSGITEFVIFFVKVIFIQTGAYFQLMEMSKFVTLSHPELSTKKIKNKLFLL